MNTKELLDIVVKQANGSFAHHRSHMKEYVKAIKAHARTQGFFVKVKPPRRTKRSNQSADPTK